MDTKRLKKLDLSYMSMANIILVSTMTRPGGRIGYPKKGIDDLREVLRDLNVYFFEDEPTNGRVPVTISVDEDHFKLYKKAFDVKFSSREESIRIFGDFYGYPLCCVEKYIEDLKKGVHPILRYWNQLIEYERKFDLFGIFHVPCSPTCEKSKSLDNAFLKELNKIDKEIANVYLDGRKSNQAWALAIHVDYYASQG